MKRLLIFLFPFMILVLIVHYNSIEKYYKIQAEELTMINLTVDAGKIMGESTLRNHGLGQGGLSDETWMISDHISQLKNLNPKYIRLFVQEYYDLYPERNVYNWKKLDAVIDCILETGAKPLMCICFKPKVLYPMLRFTP